MGFFSRLLGRSSANTPPPAPAAEPDAPPIAQVVSSGQSRPLALAPEVEVTPLKRPLFARDPLIDQSVQIIGYEFKPRPSVEKIRAQAQASTRRLFDEALLRGLVSGELGDGVSNKDILFTLPAGLLAHPLVDQLPLRRLGLFVRMDDGTPPDDTLLARLVQLKERGILLGLSDLTPAPELKPLMLHADLLRFTITTNDMPQLDRQARALRQINPRARLIAAGVQSFEELLACRKIQLDGFQGNFLHFTSQLADGEIDVSGARLMNALNLVRQNASPADLAAAIKFDPVLVFKLLRFVNSPAAGLGTKVDSLERALLVLGQQRLYRWLTVLLYSRQDKHATPAALLTAALTRARLMELLAQPALPKAEQEQLFTTGMLSLLDRVMQRPLASVLSHIVLPDTIRAALLEGTGPYAPYLTLAIASETDGGDLHAALARSGIDAATFNQALLGAMAWAEEAETSE
jgi:EAL and modified HD-GYP domain-containing signal transduction protein